MQHPQWVTDQEREKFVEIRWPGPFVTKGSFSSCIPILASIVSSLSPHRTTRRALDHRSGGGNGVHLTSVIEATSRQRVARLLLSDDTTTNVPMLVIGASLALAIAVIHLQDQGGLLGNISPAYLKYGYYAVEISSTISAALIIRGKTAGWLLGLASSIGPMTGYILSRSVGLPGDPGDVGNWGYVLGTVSLVVEGSFVIMAVACLMRIATAWRRNALTVEAAPSSPHRDRRTLTNRRTARAPAGPRPAVGSSRLIER